MVDNRRISGLENVVSLANPNNEGLLCASCVSFEKQRTFNDAYSGRTEPWQFGVSLDCENANIANATLENQVSGSGKGWSQFADLVNDTKTVGSKKLEVDYRKTVSDFIKLSLGLSDDEYAELYKNVQKYKYVSQFDYIQDIVIGSKRISGAQIKSAIQQANDSILSTNQHNELNLYAPKVNAVVAKVDSLDKVPSRLLAFAQEHNLPIYLLGN